MITRYIKHMYIHTSLFFQFICLLQNFKHLLKTLNTCMLWSASNRKVVMGLYDAYKQAQVRKKM